MAVARVPLCMLCDRPAEEAGKAPELVPLASAGTLYTVCQVCFYLEESARAWRSPGAQATLRRHPDCGLHFGHLAKKQYKEGIILQRAQGSRPAPREPQAKHEGSRSGAGQGQGESKRGRPCESRSESRRPSMESESQRPSRRSRSRPTLRSRSKGQDGRGSSGWRPDGRR